MASAVGASSVNVVIQGALERARSEYASRDILVDAVLEADADVEEEPGLLASALETIFLALPRRLDRSSVLYVGTRDVDGGIEISWEGREEVPEKSGDARAAAALGRGPEGDLLELAIDSLARHCRARMGFLEETRGPAWSSSAFPETRGARRRVIAFIPIGSLRDLEARKNPPARSRRSLPRRRRAHPLRRRGHRGSAAADPGFSACEADRGLRKPIT